MNIIILCFLAKWYISLGCWRDCSDGTIIGKDCSDRAIQGNLGDIAQDLGVQGCYKWTRNKGYTVFGVQYGGQCYTTATAEETYDKYGSGRGCSSAGTGAGWLNEVYKITSTRGKQILPILMI